MDLGRHNDYDVSDPFSSLKSGMYGQPSDINRTLIGNKIVNH